MRAGPRPLEEWNRSPLFSSFVALSEFVGSTSASDSWQMTSAMASVEATRSFLLVVAVADGKGTDVRVTQKR